MTKYIAKPNTWFDKGTEARLLENYGKTMVEVKEHDHLVPTEYGLFEGMRKGRLDQETCDFLEFDIIEE